jgi:uncharacterized protein (UPF0264 family)
MNNDFEELQIKIPNISTMLEDLGNYIIQVLNNENGTAVPVRNTSEYDYVKNYIYKLKADNEALNLIVDKLTAKEEKDKWISVTYGRNNEYSVLTKISNIDCFEYVDDKIVMYLVSNQDAGYLLSKESYEELKNLLLGNKENE